MMKQEELVQALRTRQAAFAESDLAFSHRLGISRQAWQFIRTGVKRPGLRTLRGVRAAFPELTDATDAFISAPEIATTAT